MNEFPSAVTPVTGGGSVRYLRQPQAEGRDADPAEPPERLQGDGGAAAGQQLDERQEAEVIVTDEELQEDVQRAGEHAVRHGHGDPQQSAPDHVHGGFDRGGGAGGGEELRSGASRGGGPELKLQLTLTKTHKSSVSCGFTSTRARRGSFSPEEQEEQDRGEEVLL